MYDEGHEFYEEGSRFECTFPIHFAIDKGHYDVFKFLLSFTKNLNLSADAYQFKDCENYYEMTPIQIAIKRGHLRIVEALIQKLDNPIAPFDEEYYVDFEFRG